MIDTLKANLLKLIKPALWNSAGLSTKEYYVLTLHRPSNVDDIEKFTRLMTTINTLAKTKVGFLVHPRTKKNLDRINESIDNIIPIDP